MAPRGLLGLGSSRVLREQRALHLVKIRDQLSMWGCHLLAGQTCLPSGGNSKALLFRNHTFSFPVSLLSSLSPPSPQFLRSLGGCTCWYLSNEPGFLSGTLPLLAQDTDFSLSGRELSEQSHIRIWKNDSISSNLR